MQLAEAVLEALRAYGAREIFGIPGDFALPFFKVIEESGILPLHTLSHEPAVGFAADAAARFHGGLGVAAVTYGAGAFNLVNAVAGAYAEKSPVVVISGAPGRAREPLGPAPAPPGPHARHPVPRLSGDHLRPGAARRSGDGTRRDRARAARGARPGAAGLYRAAARHGGRRGAAPVPVLRAARRRPRGGRRLRRRDHGAAGRGQAAGDAWSTSRCAATGSRPRWPSSPAGWACRSSPPSWAAACSPTHRRAAGRDLSRRRRRSRRHRAGRGLGRAPAAGRDPERHQFRRERRQARSAAHHPGARPAGRAWASTPTPTSRWPTWSTRCSRARSRSAPARPPAPAAGLPARARRPTTAPIAPDDIARAVNDLFDRHGPMPIAADIGDCLFTAMEIAHTDAHRARLLRRHGLRRAGRDRRPARDRAADADPGRRRRLPDDRLGARQLPPARHRPDRGPVQQCELGDAARLPARIRASTTSTTGASPTSPTPLGGEG